MNIYPPSVTVRTEISGFLEVSKSCYFINQPELISMLGFSSKRAAKKVLKQFQSLRNNLAHAQDISTYDWAQIALISTRMLDYV